MVLTRLFPTEKEKKKQSAVQKKSMKKMKETQDEEKSVESYARHAVEIGRSMQKSRLSDAAREQVRGLKFQVENKTWLVLLKSVLKDVQLSMSQCACPVDDTRSSTLGRDQSAESVDASYHTIVYGQRGHER